MKSKRKVFDTVDVDDNAIKLAIIRPTNRMNQEANMSYNLKMASLIRLGAQDSSQRLLLRAELEEYLNKIGVWSMKDALEIETLATEIRACELLLKKGGIKISEGRQLAVKMSAKRQLIMQKHAKRQQFDSATIESQAENFRFEIIMTKCLVFADTGDLFLKNHNEYIERQDEIAIIDGAKILANMVYGLEETINKNMFEIQWLQDAGMIDESGQYITKDGVATDENGRLINADGRYINEDGVMVDTFGRPVDERGNLLVDISKPFIDDDSGKDVIIGNIGLKSKDKKETKGSISKKKKRKKSINKQDS